MTVPHEQWLVVLSICIAIQGSFVGLLLARGLDQAEGFRRRILLAGAVADVGDRRMVDAFRWHARRRVSFGDRLSGAPDPSILSDLRDRRRNWSVCRPCRRIPDPTHWHWRSRDGARHQPDALCRDVGGASGGADEPGNAVRCTVCRDFGRGERHRFVDAGAPRHPLARARGRRRAWAGDFWHALHRHGRHEARSPVFRRHALRRRRFCLVAQRAGATDDDDRLWRFGRLSSVAGAGRQGPGSRRRPHSPRQISAITRFLRQRPKAPPVAQFDRPAEQDRRQPQSISVEKDGRAREISIDDIFAVRANAHYSYVNDGEQEYFCGLAISAIEARLDPARFIRVHRSHIVAIDRVASLKRDGENGVAELAAPVRCTIPIARSHFRQVKQLVEARIV